MSPRRMITTDCHIAPPFSLVEQLPESYRRHFTRLVRRKDGSHLIHPVPPAAAALMMGDGPGSGATMVEVPVDDDPQALAKAAVGNVCPEATPSFDPVAQLADLERDGVYGAVLIGRIHTFDDGVPAEVDTGYCEVVNDWLAETWGPIWIEWRLLSTFLIATWRRRCANWSGLLQWDCVQRSFPMASSTGLPISPSGNRSGRQRMS